jgi:ribosomal protein L16 Arg81 hydroxylase
MNSLFAKLIAPITPEEFFGTHWEQRFLRVTREAAGYYDEALRLADLDTIFQGQFWPALAFNVVKDGVAIAPEQWTTREHSPIGETARVAVPDKLLALYHDGATLILNRAHRALPALGRWCRALEKELGMHARANVYLTPPRAQGFAAHYDTQDVFILPLHGHKCWRLYHTPVELPIRGQPVRDLSESLPPPQHEFELRAGDLLYLPRGLAHEARATASASVHITLALQPRYGFHLIETLAQLAQDEPAFRRALPHKLTSDRDRAAFADAFRAQLQALLERWDFAALLERAQAAATEDQLAAAEGRVTDALRVDGIGLDTVLARRAVEYQLERDGQVIRVKFAGRELAVPSLLAPALETLLQDQPFAVRDLKGLLTPARKIALAQQAVRAGLLTITGER